MKLRLDYEKTSTLPFNIVDGFVEQSEEHSEEILEGEVHDLQENVRYKFTVKDGHFRTFVYLQQASSRESRFSVKCVYLLCESHPGSTQLFEDGRFECPFWMDGSKQSASRRISLGVAMIQAFLLKTVGKAFHTELDLDTNLPKVYHFVLKQSADDLWKLSALDLWRHVANSLMNSDLSSSTHKFVAFLSFSRYKADHEKPLWDASSQVSGYSSYGGSGLALLSTHCLYTWPAQIGEIEYCFRDDSAVNMDEFMNDSNHRNTLTGCYSTTLGATVHEICHTFNLGHSHVGIMSHEFHDINHFFLEAKIQYSKPWFTESQIEILYNHKWFKHNIPSAETSRPFSYSISEKILASINSLKVIEIRSNDDEFTLYSKVFKSSQTKLYNFNEQTSELEPGSFVLFAIDGKGNIFETIICNEEKNQQFSKEEKT